MKNSPFFRSVEFDRGQINTEDRTIPVAFSSEYPVDRGDYDEVLDHTADGCDLSRLNNSAAVLLNHDMNRQVGVVEKPDLNSAEKKSRALIRFGRSELATEIFNDVKDGIRQHMSVGYERVKVMSSDVKQGGRKAVRFAWRPFELSIVPVPADPSVGVGRSAAGLTSRTMSNEDCACLCRVALSATNKALGAIEGCQEASGAHAKAAALARDVIAALAIVIEDINYWSEASAAECVAVCAECAGYCDGAVAALRAVASCAHCGREASEAVEELEEAAECCRQNAGLEPINPAAATEAEVEAKTGLADGASQKDNPTVDTRTLTKTTEHNESSMSTPGITNGTATTAVEVETRAVETERMRCRNIRAAADKIAGDFPEGADKFRALADTSISEGKSVDDFHAQLLAAMPGVRKATMITAESLGMSRREVNRYSLSRAIQSILRTGRPEPEGLEGEVHGAMSKRIKESGAAVSGSGFWVPHDIEMPVGPARRDLNVTTPTQGGNFVQTSIFTPIIEILRNRMVTQRLGVQSMAGLEGNIAIPRQTGAATAYSLVESASLTKSTQAIDQILLTPHRVGAYNEYSKQLLLQSSIDVENFIRDDLMKVLAIKWDKLILEGSGQGSEPTGILHTEAIGSVTFGAAPTFAKAVSFETALSLANADIGSMSYVTTPTVRGVWKVTPKVASSTFPIFLWEKGDWKDGSNDGEVNGYRAACTNQIAGNAVAFGNWSDAIHALWGGYDVVVNPYSRDIDAVVRITVNTFGDVAARHAASFAWSADSGAQS